MHVDEELEAGVVGRRDTHGESRRRRRIGMGPGKMTARSRLVTKPSAGGVG
jgi:hypothetical protein